MRDHLYCSTVAHVGLYIFCFDYKMSHLKDFTSPTIKFLIGQAIKYLTCAFAAVLYVARFH